MLLVITFKQINTLDSSYNGIGAILIFAMIIFLNGRTIGMRANGMRTISMGTIGMEDNWHAENWHGRQLAWRTIGIDFLNCFLFN